MPAVGTTSEGDHHQRIMTMVDNARAPGAQRKARHRRQRKLYIDVGRWWLGYFDAGREVYLCLIPGWVIIYRRARESGKPDHHRISPHL